MKLYAQNNLNMNIGMSTFYSVMKQRGGEKKSKKKINLLENLQSLNYVGISKINSPCIYQQLYPISKK